MTVPADIITGVLSSLAYDGLKRPYKVLADEIQRRRRISRDLTAHDSAAPTRDHSESDVIISDLAKAAGNDYSESVAKFLMELDRSGIPDAMRQLTLCGRDVAKLYPAFNVIYESCAPLKFGSRQFYDALKTAITTRMEQAVRDPALLEIFRAHKGDISKQLDSIEAALARAGVITDGLSISTLREIRLRIAKNIEAANRYIPVETTQGTKKIPIIKLVIPARLQLIEGDTTPKDTGFDGSSSITALSFRRGFHHAVILGNPGGGKSTLTQHLCFLFAHQIVLESETPCHPKFSAEELKLPLRVILRTLEKRQQNTAGYSILDYLEDELRLVLDNDAALARQFLARTLTIGQCVVLFDGLDEILDVSARRNMVAQIEQFANNYAACPVLVTSRIVGYRDAPLADDYENYTLASFNREEVKKFSERLISAVGNLKAKEAEAQASTFVTQTETVAEDLRTNPLLLGLMVYIFVMRGDVPNNTPEIYKECSLLMFEKWDQRRDIKFEFPHDFDLLDLFGYLAVKIFGNVEAEDGVDEQWLVREMRLFFENWYEDRAKAVAAARIMVEFITGRAWVMCDIGPGKFKFTHRTFLEYFVARRIEEESGSIPELLKRLVSKISKSQWDVVSHLALQIATFRSAPKSLQAFDAIGGLLSSQDFSPTEQINLLTFASRALQYLSLPEAKFREFVRSIALRAIESAAKVRRADAGRDVLATLFTSGRRRKELMAAELTAVFDEILSGANSLQRTLLL